MITRIERRRAIQAQGSSVIWLIGITDIITLMLSFFILLYAISNPRQAAWVQASQAIRTEFGGDQQITEARGEAGKKEAGNAWTSVDQDPGLDIDYLQSIVLQFVAKTPALREVTIAKENDAVIMRFPSDLIFTPGQDVLSDEGRKMITLLAPFFSQLSNSVELVGHSDPQIINDQGRFGSNWHLSLARAHSVAIMLKSAGYEEPVTIRGRGVADLDLLPKNLPDDVRNEKARRVDIRLKLQQP